jgi:hypothetical protein
LRFVPWYRPRVRRSLAFLLVAIGLVALVVGVASGCGTLFSYNGRHPIAVQPLAVGTPLRHTFPGKAGRRYTVAVHVVFDRDAVPESNGQLVVEARFPLVASIEDAAGLPAAKITGWLDPSQPPTVLYGHSASATQRRPMGAGPEELVAERLVGPYLATQDRDVMYVVELGPDTVARTPVRETRIVIYDDKLPTSITVAFAVAGAGALALFAGSILLFLGGFRARRGGTRRRQIV